MLSDFSGLASLEYWHQGRKNEFSLVLPSQLIVLCSARAVGRSSAGGEPHEKWSLLILPKVRGHFSTRKPDFLMYEKGATCFTLPEAVWLLWEQERVLQTH